MERKEFEMTQSDLDKIIDACKPVPYMIVGSYPPRSLHDKVNAAWAELGNRMGFDYMTVKSTARGDRFFSAVPKDKEGSEGNFLSIGHQLRNSKLTMEDIVNGHFIHCPLWFGLAYWVLLTL